MTLQAAQPPNPADPQAALLHAFLATTAELRDRVRKLSLSWRSFLWPRKTLSIHGAWLPPQNCINDSTWVPV